MHFWDIVTGSEGYLSPYKVLSYLYGKCGHGEWNWKYTLGNQWKVICPIVNLTITSNKHYHGLLSYFHGHLALICCWHGFLMSIFIAICNSKNVSYLWKFTDIMFLPEVLTTSGFERDRDAILVIW